MTTQPINIIQGLLRAASAAVVETIYPEQSERFTGYVCYARGQPLKLDTFHPERLSPMDVQLRVSYAGLCHTDVTMIRDEVGLAKFPFVPGHEIVGVVDRVGPEVTELKVGDVVGAGFFRRCCFQCSYCNDGFDNICSKAEPISGVNGAAGGFANFVRLDSRLAFKLPEGIPHEQAPPIFCAGATVFSPLKRYVKPGMKVGIVGLGGLGHIAVQIAKAMGAEVYVLSHSPNKRSDALNNLKADHFVDTNSSSEMEALKETLDLILVTLYGNVQAGSTHPLFDVVKAGTGIICYLGWLLRDLNINAYPLIYRQRTVVGSNVASTADIRELLDFWVKHSIVTCSDVYAITDVNAVLDRFAADPAHEDLRFRAVFAVHGHIPAEVLPPAAGLLHAATLQHEAPSTASQSTTPTASSVITQPTSA